MRSLVDALDCLRPHDFHVAVEMHGVGLQSTENSEGPLTDQEQLVEILNQPKG